MRCSVEELHGPACLIELKFTLCVKKIFNLVNFTAFTLHYVQKMLDTGDTFLLCHTAAAFSILLSEWCFLYISVASMIKIEDTHLLVGEIGQ